MQTVADSKELSRATVLVAAPLSILSTPEAGYPLHLQAVHNLNGSLMQASTLVECEEMGASAARESALKSMLHMVASGEPHSYMAIKALHFAAFSEESRKLLASLQLTQQLLGMLRAASGLEPELTYSALSLLATLSWTDQGDTSSPASSKALVTVVGKFLADEESGPRRLAHQIVQSQLQHPQGLRAAAGSKRLKAQLEYHLSMETNKEERADIRQTLDYIACIQRFTRPKDSHANRHSGAAGNPAIQ
ncbi:uncharacterized protein LOC142356442 isoform X2 [Convolutriloba macropyga]|uniref:uncharacterized protein LOC142356442 isoform X2 n=1 Tax=Convolutriloba macropyga TaxID=536237 RepID=UPI003F524D7B